MDACLSRLNLARLAYLLAVATLTVTCGYVGQSQASAWLIWIAFTFSVVTLGDTRLQQSLLLLALTADVMLVVTLSTWAISSPLLLLVYLASLTLICVYLGRRIPLLAYPAGLINLFAVLACLPLAGEYPLQHEIMNIMGGAVIVILCQWLYQVGNSQSEVRSSLTASVLILRQLANDLFESMVVPDYADHLYLYERRIHKQKNRYLLSLERMEKVARSWKGRQTSKRYQVIARLLSDLYQLYDNLMDCAQLRHRVDDFHLFSLCRQEMQWVVKAFDQLFLALSKVDKGTSLEDDFIRVMEAIQCFEANNESVLQVTAKEPMIFLWFIASLKTMCTNAKGLQARMREWMDIKESR
ncbi:MAG: hypothetical protein A3E85_03740 [Gammaproteobacteria bacterium RIFCSPHIGHO2_12_FULL_45_12]|nr:MAG: hypothetical protein A3E85_03740 [Gammaproteobacteria bacterium RIFCSPHIGHO2_12_FULL_45_12]